MMLGISLLCQSVWAEGESLPEEKEYIVVGDDTYPPLTFKNNKNQPSGYDIDVYREANEDDDVELREFVGTDEGDIEQWIVDELRKVGLNTAKSVLDKETDALVNLTDLEEETIEEVKRILREELED